MFTAIHGLIIIPMKKFLHKKIFYDLALLSRLLPFVIFVIYFLASCNRHKKPAGKEMVDTAEQMDSKVKELIKISLSYTISNNGQLNDSTWLTEDSTLSFLYKENEFVPFWCSAEKWRPQADSLFNFIAQARLYGLFPSDYHFSQLRKIWNMILADSITRDIKSDAALWTRAELMMSDALVTIFKHIKLGRLPTDSVTLRRDSVLSEEFIKSKFKKITTGSSLVAVIESLEPKHKGYHELKAGIKSFLAKADFSEIATIKYPDKNPDNLKASVVKRLFESGYFDTTTHILDSLALSKILLKFQKERRLTPDGKIGPQTIRELNSSDREKFIRIAITMDRYKMLPEEMPEKYIWVNIPSYTMKLYNRKSLIVSGRIVVGKPKTRTPVLTSSIYEMITYPQWTIPQSIIVKEILPALKRDPGYLARKGYSLFDSKGEETDPFSVDWSKYNKGIPYRVIQGSGDANALGVLKFNFSNKYAVYLHDTNQRFYFGLDSRALSHGCVRVQEWEKVAFFIMENEKTYSLKNKKRYVPIDSLNHWLKVKEKHIISLNDRIPVFIRYYTCEGLNGRVIFYEDIYNEDRELQDNFFKAKEILI